MSSFEYKPIKGKLPEFVLPLNNTAEIDYFDAVMAVAVNPDFDKLLWEFRYSLSSLIRPAGYIGTLGNMRLVSRPDEPFRNLRKAARDKKVTFDEFSDPVPANKGRVVAEVIQRANTHRFSIIGDTLSSAPEKRGQFQADVWYFPSLGEQKSREVGREVLRVVTTPEFTRYRNNNYDELNPPLLGSAGLPLPLVTLEEFETVVYSRSDELVYT
jgi:hypothetical protein